MCGVGVAPDASISGIRLIADYTTDAMEVRFVFVFPVSCIRIEVENYFDFASQHCLCTSCFRCLLICIDGRKTNKKARALTYQIQKNDIFSCSWGPDDDGMRLEGPEEITAQVGKLLLS